VYGDGTQLIGYSAVGVGHTVPVHETIDLAWFCISAACAGGTTTSAGGTTTSSIGVGTTLSTTTSAPATTTSTGGGTIAKWGQW
jgi:acetylxylan esterase